MVRLQAGTSGYSYKEWKGPFYPEDIKPAEMLRYYASRLPAVEINNTFYRMPKRDVVAKWASEVPEHFVFVLKASQRITHQKRLKDAGEPLRYLLDTSEALKGKRGPFLFQLPPFLRKDVERLKRFLGTLPDGIRGAFEFRHESWMDDEVFGALRDAGQALCIADTDEGDAPPVVATADWAYLRLRRMAYTDQDLAAWADKIKREEWKEAYVFFKHEDEGAGPKMAERFLGMFPA